MGRRVLSVAKRLITYYSMSVYGEPIESYGDFTNIIFLHHSVGQDLITEGNVRSLLTGLGYQFWDHGYNHTGLVRPDGTLTGAHYRIPGAMGRGDTDVGGLAKLFSEPVTDPPSNAFSRLMQHDVIIVKSCFPNSAIKSDAMREDFENWYLQMRDVMDQHLDHIFLVVTSPPLHPQQTNSDEARRARTVANWLTSNVFLEGHPNVFTFDLFDLLADPSANTLRSEYQRETAEPNAHPNRLANEEIGPVFVRFIDEAVKSYRKGESDAQ